MIRFRPFVYHNTINVLATVLTLAGIALVCASAAAETAPDYREPSAAVVELLTAAPPPEPLLHSRSRRIALLYKEPVTTLERVMRPRLGLAGFRFDPATRTSGIYPLVTRVEFLTADASAAAKKIEWLPRGGALLDFIHFSPDGRMLSALAIADGQARLVLFDIESGRERRLDAEVNAAWGAPCNWAGNDALLCRVVPQGLGKPPAEFGAPMIVAHEGAAAPERTYAYLLRNAWDDALFEHYFSVEVARIGIDGRQRRVTGLHGLIEKLDLSPDGAFAVVTRIERPYSRLVPARRFPSVVEAWDLEKGVMLYDSRSADAGSDEHEDERERPRRSAWKPGSPVTLGFIESVRDADGNRLHHWYEISATIGDERREIVQSKDVIKRFGWTSAGTPWYITSGEGGEGVRVYTVGTQGARMIWSGSTTNRYDNPGHALGLEGVEGPVLETNGTLFLAGDGQGPGGPQPFLDTFNFTSGETRRLFEAEAGVFERVIGLTDPHGAGFVTYRETVSDSPQLFLHAGGTSTALGSQPDPYPQLQGATRQVLNYKRADGVGLSGTLYLPPGRQEGERLPTLVWIYPYEFTDREQAEQLDLRAFRFHQVKGPSPLAAVVAGYAVLMNPTVPIMYEGSMVNDTYLPQLVASLDAAVDHLVSLGVTDPARIAVAGRSYGSFSSANLMIHSDRFATAICMSGAYNRTLTPFGFQHEKRSFWEAGEMYASISPFFHADRVKKPVLFIHGGGDENAGTPPIQARRFVHALIGQGATVRYVELPFEGHHYWARENVLLAAAEMLDWMERTIGHGHAMTDAQDTKP